MSQKIDWGGSAFPQPDTRYPRADEYNGMTLRDYFAAAAMQGLATNQSLLLNDAELVDRIGTLAIDKLQANKAYRLADAMLEERNKP